MTISTSTMICFAISIATTWFCCARELNIRAGHHGPVIRDASVVLGLLLAIIPPIGIAWFVASRRARGTFWDDYPSSAENTGDKGPTTTT